MTFVTARKYNHTLQNTVVFLPGWGFDGQVARYGMWPDDVNLLVPETFCHPGLASELRDYLISEKIAKVALVGWSMGANLAWQFAANFPEQVTSLSLLSARTTWPEQEIAAIKRDLGAGLEKSMQGFYRKCFLGAKDIYRHFTDELESDYLARLRREELEAGLDYLAAHPVAGPAPAGVKVQLIHGRKDVIAPASERPRIESADDEVIDAAGHLIFAQPHSYLL